MKNARKEKMPFTVGGIRISFCISDEPPHGTKFTCSDILFSGWFEDYERHPSISVGVYSQLYKLNSNSKSSPSVNVISSLAQTKDSTQKSGARVSNHILNLKICKIPDYFGFPLSSSSDRQECQF